MLLGLNFNQIVFVLQILSLAIRQLKGLATNPNKNIVKKISHLRKQSSQSAHT